MAQKKIIIVCGEPSGELHAANLIHAIKQINPELKISGIGSSLLQQAGAEIIYDTKNLSVMGLFDVLKKLPKFFALKKLILNRIASEKFDAIIFVDFSGFNLRLAKAINNRIPTIYYVSPQVWASRVKRIETIKKYIRKMIVLFEFEKEFYKKYGITADYVGHPLLDIAKSDEKIIRNKTTICLLPGSRKQEIERILPVMLKAAKIISAKIDAQFIIAKPIQAQWDIYKRLTTNLNLDLKIKEGKTYDAIEASDFCMVCSGTATLETAIMQKPFLIVYKMNLLNYLLYRPQIKIPYIGIVNIVAGRKIIPEFIQFQATPQIIAGKTLEILNDRDQLEIMRKDLAKVKASLGSTGASMRAARIILDFLS